jgi:large subunit ribosomal protein L22
MSEVTKVRAYLKELRLTPRKVALVAALVRGRSVDDALVILNHTPKRAAKPLAKLIASARANATNNHGLKADGLTIATLSVTAGARLKRFRPVSRGMAHPFQKRTANVLVEITGEMKPVAKKVEKTDKADQTEAKSKDKKETK